MGQGVIDFNNNNFRYLYLRHVRFILVLKKKRVAVKTDGKLCILNTGYNKNKNYKKLRAKRCWKGFYYNNLNPDFNNLFKNNFQRGNR